MGVYIKGMEMPTSCGDCKAFVCYRQWAGDRGDCFCGITKSDCKAGAQNADCPLVPVPPHGRLIEKNAVFELIRSFPNVDRQLSVEFMKALYEIPTILEAEEGET